MRQTCKTPADEAGASRDHLGGWSQSPLAPKPSRSQFLIGVRHVRPEPAAILAVPVFGGGTRHG